ncbi:hypothetical protein IJG72_05710 [bacterium]|nr:hypothetical protein [bacterium]
MGQYKYKVFKISGKNFVVKMDLNPITNEYDYHMYIRHLVTPQQAIAAYFTKTYETYNQDYDRYELYSKTYDITVYYTYLKAENLLLITAFQGGSND